MFVLFTDFGESGLYLGQMRAVLHGQFPERPVLDACSTAPAFDPRASAYLLASLIPFYPRDAIWLAVVDPGVGTDREGLMVFADGSWFVGPDNGLLSRVVARAREVNCWHIRWRPGGMSASFHGRDWFAPVALQLSLGSLPDAVEVAPGALVGADWPEDLAEVIHVDHFGNLVTGLRRSAVAGKARLRVAGRECGPARTFADVAVGEPFWYVKANGLVEVAVNQGHAAVELGVRVGAPITIVT